VFGNEYPCNVHYEQVMSAIKVFVKQAAMRNAVHQGREFIANGAFCTVFSENFHKF
jgi:hypothetical protein